MNNSPFDPDLPQFPYYPPPVTPKPLGASYAEIIASLQPQPPPFSLADLIQPIRPRIFVSYQHSSDQYYYNEFSRIFHDAHEAIFDNSLERIIDSEDSEYVIQRIRDEFITGTSCSIVLVGPTSHQRKYLDWEIKATLDREHGLIGIQLPHLPPRWDGLFSVPLRFAENVRSGYALWVHWNALIAEPHALPKLIEIACNRPNDRIINRHEIMKRNG